MHGAGDVVVDFRSPTGEWATAEATAAAFSTLPCVVIGLVNAKVEPTSVVEVGAVCDVILTEAEHDRFGDELHRSIGEHRFAAAALALHLRGSKGRTLEQGLVAESTVYSLLQSGPEFRRWLGSRTPKGQPVQENQDPVDSQRVGDSLHITLNRPGRHNAFNRAMRDCLSDALELALVDSTISEVVVRGSGASFCSGGDLSEFGGFTSPVESHLTRLTRSPARLLARLHDITTVVLHGTCYGAGIELPAFAKRVIARSDTRIRLPELGLGLIPGAGGTVSMPLRIGRHRTALLGLSQTVISASTALEWGLIDAIDDE